MTKILNLNQIQKTPEEKFQELRGLTVQLFSYLMNEVYEIDTPAEFEKQYGGYFKVIEDVAKLKPNIPIDKNTDLNEIPTSVKRLYSINLMINLIQKI